MTANNSLRTEVQVTLEILYIKYVIDEKKHLTIITVTNSDNGATMDPQEDPDREIDHFPHLYQKLQLIPDKDLINPT
jgi:hypothetical protein